MYRKSYTPLNLQLLSRFASQAPEDAQGLHAGPLRSLVALCVGDVPSERPPFAMVEAVLRGMDVGAPKAAVVAA